MASLPKRRDSSTQEGCYLAVATGSRDRLQNLTVHCVLVLTKNYDPETGYAAESQARVAPLRRDLSSPEANAHLAIISECLANLEGYDGEPEGLSSDRRRDISETLCRFRQAVDRLTRNTKSSDDARIASFRCTLEEALVRWPFALASYISEIAGIATDKPGLLALVGQSMTHARSVQAVGVLQEAHRLLSEHFRNELNGGAPHVQRNAPPQREACLQQKRTGHSSPIGTHMSTLSAGQKRVFDYCAMLSRLHAQAAENPGGSIQGRFWPLIAAPSGSGKSALLRLLAKHLGYHYLRFQRGDMVPLGAKGRATQYAILDALVEQARPVLVHWDEVDKFILPDGMPAPTQEWSAGIWSCLYSTLDGAMSFDTYLRLVPAERATPADAATKVTEEFLRERVRKSLFHVASGTWQAVFNATSKRSLGFGSGQSETLVTAKDLLNSRQIPAELFLRFHSEIQILNYPSPDEISRLLDETGLSRLASECNYEIRPEDLDFQIRGGFRAFETLYTKLLVRQHEKQRDELMGPETAASNPNR